MKFPVEFINRACELYTDLPYLRQKLEKGDTFILTMLNNDRNIKMSPGEILKNLAAKNYAAIKKAAEDAEEARHLYEIINEIYRHAV